MLAKHIRLLPYRTAMLDDILGLECSNNGLKSYLHMTIQYKINLQDKMKTKCTSTALYILFCAKIPFGGHLGCHAYFLKIILGMLFIRQLQMHVLTAKCGK